MANYGTWAVSGVPVSKDMKSVTEMVDYVRQLRLHAAGRRSVHVRLSRLEKHYREEHYRRFVAVTLRQLITNFGATMFALPNTDVVLIVKDAKVESIDPLLNHIRRKFRDSELIKSLDPIQGESDAFVEWFDLEADYAGFRKYIEKFADSLQGKSEPEEEQEETQSPTTNQSPGVLELGTPPKEKVAPPKRKVRMVPIEAPGRDIEMRDFDPELMVALTKALVVADVGGLMRKQKVMAILGVQQPQTVMVHKYVPASVVLERLLKTQVVGKDRWLQGYLDELLASRLLYASPNMQNENSIASSMRVSCAAVADSAFQQFDASLGGQARSTIILEFGATDILTNFGAYRAAQEKIVGLGYRAMVADVDPRALLWLDYHNFDADFVKLSMPPGNVSDWLDFGTEDALQQQVSDIGIARVILDGCNSDEAVEAGQRLGITLFQGDAVSPMTA